MKFNQNIEFSVNFEQRRFNPGFRKYVKQSQIDFGKPTTS